MWINALIQWLQPALRSFLLESSVFEIVAKFLLALVFSFFTLVTYAVWKHSVQVYENPRLLEEVHFKDESLFPLLQSHMVSIEEICKRGYAAVLSVVQMMIGVRPTGAMVMAIWSPAFDCYNLIVPNLLNMPESIFGFGPPGAAPLPKDLSGLAIHAASRANDCSYCTAHTCTYALRRGLDSSVLRNMLQDDNENDALTPVQRAVVKVCWGLGTTPATLCKEDVHELYKTMSPEHVEWIVASSGAFGALNKLMNGLGAPLERSTYAETVETLDPTYKLGTAGGIVLLDKKKKKERAPLPPKDDWTVSLAFLYHGLKPGGAMALDTKLLKGIPNTAVDCKARLQSITGHSFHPIMDNICYHVRFRRAITAVIATNFEQSAGLGVHIKIKAGIVYANILENKTLENDMQVVAKHFRVDAKSLEDPKSLLVLRLAKQLSYSPVRVTNEMVGALRASDIDAEMLVELVSFLACLQMIHRIEMFYDAREAPPTL